LRSGQLRALLSIDRSSSLPVSLRVPSFFGQDDVWEFGDYRERDGVVFARDLVVQRGGNVGRTQIRSIEAAPSGEAGLFAAPTSRPDDTRFAGEEAIAFRA